MQRANKDALEKLDPNQVYHTFPDRREGSSSSLILKKPKTKKSNRVLYMTKPLKEELLGWLEKLKQDEQAAPEKYSNCGQLFRLPDGLPIAPELLTKWYRQWRSAHPEFEQIIHQLRNSSKYVSYKDLKQLMVDLKAVYAAVDEPAAQSALDTFEEAWGKKYPRIAASWRENWANLSTYFKFPQEVRRLIYTTNAIEGFNRQLRKVTKSKAVFPTDDSLLKMLYLAMMDITKKWTGRRQDWSVIHAQLAIYYADRMPE